MAKTIKFFKKDGEVQYKDFMLKNLEAAFSTIRNGNYTLTIKRDVKRRSLDQNALMWLWFTCIEKETGTDKNDVHDHYCSKFLRRTIIVNDKETVVISGTSKLNTLQFTDFLNKVQADAASEFGIILPRPEDQAWEYFKLEYGPYIYN